MAAPRDPQATNYGLLAGAAAKGIYASVKDSVQPGYIPEVLKGVGLVSVATLVYQAFWWAVENPAEALLAWTLARETVLKYVAALFLAQARNGTVINVVWILVFLFQPVLSKELMKWPFTGQLKAIAEKPKLSPEEWNAEYDKYCAERDAALTTHRMKVWLWWICAELFLRLWIIALYSVTYYYQTQVFADPCVKQTLAFCEWQMDMDLTAYTCSTPPPCVCSTPPPCVCSAPPPCVCGTDTANTTA